jgi:AcrR family transcriptional regulator
MATQEQRKAETRRRLLDAAALLFAERGIDAVSIDTVADAADRTSGAVYAHFGGKDGLLTALLDELVNDTAAVMEAELTVGDDMDDQLAAAWRAFADPPPGRGRGWMLLEHELWLYAARHDEARVHLARRFAEAREQVAEMMEQWVASGEAVLPAPAEEVGSLLVALLVGLEMQHRVDPGAIPDSAAVTGLRAVTGFQQTSQVTDLRDPAEPAEQAEQTDPTEPSEPTRPSRSTR